MDALKNWEITDRVVALSFDTTSSNTGINKTVCTLTEQGLDREDPQWRVVTAS